MDNNIEVIKQEDERIRKELIDFLKEEEAKADITSKRSETLCKYIAWLEKQGEQKETLCDKCRKEQPSHSCQDITALGRCAIEYEQKPADKVEPKFKVGDWVAYNHNPNLPPKKIIQITNKHYVFADCSFETKTLETDWHLWTIKDAKDGDVLATKAGGIFIYKELLYDKPFAYCGVDKFGVFKDCNCGDGLDWTPYLSDVTPATKEQCDFLFQKMKEDGYEWDAEKKELKKIYELDNSRTRVTFPFKAKVKSSGAIVTIHNGQLSPDGKEWTKYQSDAEDRYKVYKPNDLELVCEIEQKPTVEMKTPEESLGIDSDTYNKIVDECIFGEQKSTVWSKEDELHIRELERLVKQEWAMAECENDKDKIHKMSDLSFFLKTLKPQLKQEWSEEDERNASYICAALDCYYRLREDRNNTNGQEDLDKARNWLYNKLKSLRPQNTWKPSDEQIRVCKEVYADILSAKGFDIGTVNGELNRLEEGLKKLKD